MAVLMAQGLSRYRWHAVIFAILAALAVFDIHRFTVWKQLLDAYPEWTGDPLIPRPQLDVVVQFPRVALMYPVMALAHGFSLNRDALYSFVVLGNLLAASLFLGATASRSGLFGNQGAVRASLGYFAFFCALSFAMNGRMSFSFLGSSVLIYLHERRREISFQKYVVGAFAAAWPIAVSSGTFIVGFAWIAFTVYSYGREQGARLSAVDRALGLGFLALLGVYSVLCVNKNLLFYRGDFLEMLKHGAGKYLFTPIGLLLVAGVAGAGVLAYRFRGRWLTREAPVFLVFAVVSGVLGGVFGYSTATVAVAPLLILLTGSSNAGPRSQVNIDPEGVSGNKGLRIDDSGGPEKPRKA